MHTAEPEDLSRRAQSTQRAPPLEKVGEDARRRAVWRRWVRGGTRLGRAIRALNVVRFLSAGFHDSPLSFMFCSPSTACPGVNLFTSSRTQHTFSNSERVSFFSSEKFLILLHVLDVFKINAEVFHNAVQVTVSVICKEPGMISRESWVHVLRLADLLMFQDTVTPHRHNTVLPVTALIQRVTEKIPFKRCTS